MLSNTTCSIIPWGCKPNYSAVVIVDMNMVIKYILIFQSPPMISHFVIITHRQSALFSVDPISVVSVAPHHLDLYETPGRDVVSLGYVHLGYWIPCMIWFINAWCAFFLPSINIFLSFLNTEMVHVVKILPHQWHTRTYTMAADDLGTPGVRSWALMLLT